MRIITLLRSPKPSSTCNSVIATSYCSLYVYVHTIQCYKVLTTRELDITILILPAEYYCCTVDGYFIRESIKISTSVYFIMRRICVNAEMGFVMVTFGHSLRTLMIYANEKYQAIISITETFTGHSHDTETF